MCVRLDTSVESAPPSFRDAVAWQPSTTVTATTVATTAAPVALRSDCQTCHLKFHGVWVSGMHADTQDDVAIELGEDRAGEAPADVIHGADAENCIACHAPTSGAAMSDVDALGNFFTTQDGVFAADTAPADTQEWPAVTCTACHEVSVDDPVSSMPKSAAFDSATASYTHVDTSSELCGSVTARSNSPTPIT